MAAGPAEPEDVMSETDYPVPPTRPGRWFFIQCERHGWLYYLTLPYWMARCRRLSRRTP